MDVHEKYERRRQALWAELNDEPFFGPFLVRNGRDGAIGSGLVHTGYSLNIATADRKVDAWILQSEDRYHRSFRTLVVPKTQIGFGFHYFREDLVGLLELLEHIASIRETPLDIHQLVLDLEPVMARSFGAPLKANALRCLIEPYREYGLAVAPAKLQKAAVVMRLVWVYPEDRKPRSISQFLPVGTLKFPLLPDGSLGPGSWDLPMRNPLLWRLRDTVSEEHRRDAWLMLSEEGQNDILALLQAKADGGHPRTKMIAKRRQFIAEHPHLWSKPRELARLLREQGLFSSKTNLGETAEQVERYIHDLQGE